MKPIFGQFQTNREANAAARELRKAQAYLAFLTSALYLGIISPEAIWEETMPFIDTLFEQADEMTQEKMIKYFEQLEEA